MLLLVSALKPTMQKALSSLFHSRPQSTSRGSSSMERKVSDNSNGSGIVPLDSFWTKMATSLSLEV
ncbi:hypothetical protein F4825DRAFT_437063 [Nemania diffusa]|nr:hypothetical protein F4825DRAFT_437063 [Nemania diffusa]